MPETTLKPNEVQTMQDANGMFCFFPHCKTLNQKVDGARRMQVQSVKCLKKY